MALHTVTKSYLEPGTSSVHSAGSSDAGTLHLDVTPLDTELRRGSHASEASSSRSAQDGFYTPTYVAASAYKLSSPMRSPAQSQGQFQPSMPVRKPQKETRLFPIDVEEDDFDEGATGRSSLLARSIGAALQAPAQARPLDEPSEQESFASDIAWHNSTPFASREIEGPKTFERSWEDQQGRKIVSSADVERTAEVMNVANPLDGHDTRREQPPTADVRNRSAAGQSSASLTTSPCSPTFRNDFQEEEHEGERESDTSGSPLGGYARLSISAQEHAHRMVPDVALTPAAMPRSMSASHARSMSASHARSMSAGTATSSSASLSGESVESSGLSLFHRRLRKSSGSFRQSTRSPSMLDDANNDSNVASADAQSTEESALPYAQPEQPRIRTSTFATQMSPYDSPRKSATTMSSFVTSEILRSEDASTPFSASQRSMRPVVPPRRQSIEHDAMGTRTWTVAKERGDSDSTVQPSPHRSSPFQIARKPVPDLSQASPAFAAAEEMPRARQASPALAAAEPHNNAAKRDAKASVLPSVLIPSNFGSHPLPRSASHASSAYSRRRSSVGSGTGVADHVAGPETTYIASSNLPASTSGDLSRLDSWQQQGKHTQFPHWQRSRQNSEGGASRAPPTPSHVRASPNTHRRQSSGGKSSQPGASSTSYLFSTSVTPSTQPPTSPRSLNVWAGYKHANVSAESAGSSHQTNWRSRISPEAHRPSVVSLTGSQTGSQGFGVQSGSSQGHSAQMRPSQASVGHSLTDSSGHGLDANLQTFLNEEDIEIVEDSRFVVDDTDLYDVRRRLVTDFASLGSKWSGTNRPLSTRSRPTSGEMDGESQGLGATNVEELDNDTKNGQWNMFVGSEKERRKRLEALEARERDLSVDALGKAEMAYAHVDVWTESRKGKWVVRRPAPDDAYPTEQLPDISDPWAIPIDAKGIVRRKKLKSNIELSSTRSIVACPDCREAAELNLAHNCKTCQGSERVEMVYTVQCVVRLAQFLPLKLPAALLLGAKQPHIKYIDTADADHRTDILRDRALDGLQGAAARVVRVHNAQHGSRLLMGRVTITRRGMLSVSVKSSKSKSRRLFDVEDGPDGKITEVTHLAASPAVRNSAMGFSGLTSSLSRRSGLSSVSGTSYDRLAPPDAIDAPEAGSVGNGQTSRSNGRTSLFYSLAPSGRKKKTYANASSPNLGQVGYDEPPSPVPPLPSSFSHRFGHQRNQSDDQGSIPSVREPTASPLPLKKSLKSLFRQ